MTRKFGLQTFSNGICTVDNLYYRAHEYNIFNAISDQQMGSKYREIDPSFLRTTSIGDRRSKVSVSHFARPHVIGSGLGQFLDSLPDVLAGRNVRTVIERIVDARRKGKAVIFAMGAHVIKCGLSPIVIDLIRKSVVTTIAMNGAGAIHDVEIAQFGKTSEEVVDGLRTGTFGMARETALFLNAGASRAQQDKLGLGEALGRSLVELGSPHADASVLAAAYANDVPVTVHVSIGSDIVHMHSSADGSAIGDSSMRDFRILTQAMTDLAGGGVLMNVGSAVVLPEVILKALTMLINLGYDMTHLTGVNLDFVQHYRSNMQVVDRVRSIGGEGIALT
ncbi:MAG: hypothetical protein N3B12_07690, partial [Armatimonadetes bacterium]|nr:hypothetical protein [Armatimonadota bacterium]